MPGGGRGRRPRRGLTGADYEQALAEGRALTLDEAYTVAGA